MNRNDNNDLNKFLVLAWIKLGVFALALSGLFAVILVVGRSPKIHALIPHVDLFKSALTIHVNLSVLIWLICGGFMIFSGIQKKFRWLNKISFFICFIATLMVASGIFDGDSKSYLNNYIPFMDNVIFQQGIWLFILGASLGALSIFLDAANKPADIGSVSAIGFSSILLISVFAILHALNEMTHPENIDRYDLSDFYNLVFWGGGHLLQFAYVQILIASWWIISGNRDGIKKNFFFVASALNITFAAAGIPGIFGNDINSYEYLDFFTKHMIVVGGAAVVIALIGLIVGSFKGSNVFRNKWERNCVLWSIILFSAGGLIALNIREVNTVIPAHYHGSIIGISLAVMGSVYFLLREFGIPIRNIKLAKIQPILYGSGQLIHITGFAMSGGYGALRKTPGAMESFEGQLYMGLMGLGGLISIIGGLLFVIVVFNSFKKSND